MIDLVVVDDDLMLREGLRGWLAGASGMRLAAMAGTVDDLLAQPAPGSGVALLDLMLRDGSDPATNVVRLADAGYRVLVISVWPDERWAAATFAAGAAGYLTKDHDLDALGAAIRQVAAGETVYTPELAFACLRDERPNRPVLSPRERAVLVGYASGLTLGATARRLGIRPETAKTYLDRVKAKYREAGRPTYTKLDLANRVREDGLPVESPELGT
ncbi:response regulator transcription factor [Actinophytocola sp.]|uniref:response regulator transcription factor n=1 Tax=Actinophytocola sp. TaxID=1872138 RepID=UPI002D7F6919|nr:response regulator transcription factor [Actinophytocola sp.]HET9137793.1 response regulator transcription factor [Actinophytocola sp.]